MDYLSHEKITFAIQALLMFLNITKESHILKKDMIRKRENESLDLLEDIKLGKIEVEEATVKLNEIIKLMNRALEQYVPYPYFVTDNPENQVRSNIIAFEHYLTQELKTNHLSLQQEGPLFNESLSLWESVGNEYTSDEGEQQFAHLIQKLNKLLPQEERYPVPGKKKK